ncbi:TniB family NTP-binding protein [Pseudomonas oryzae]|uniref:TniB protein n=1 Tax=Pseudomonas oryzae TaxID=1392877 RepID=A0A1H1QCY1_9PSED|nr:TniB family NTP-binding protein [Pseudomonas oryzae]SDS21163.1 TniB protein [Pseudomonas oryzae]
MSFEHVRPDMRKYLSADIDTRISVMHQELWVDNNSSEAVFRIMNNIADVPNRMNAPALLVVGPGGSGKTAIISRIPKRVKNSNGLLMISMAETPEIKVKKSLRVELALALGLPLSSSSRSISGSEIPNEIREVIKLRKIWGVVVDEFHDALLRPKQEQRVNMSILKKLLGAEYGLKLFCFGTVSARNALQSNDEFKRRFHEVTLGDWTEDEAFRAFLLEVEESLPLQKPSNLYSEEMVKSILSIAYGRMDKTLELIRSAACYAVKLGAEQINLEMLHRAAKNPWGY